MKAKKRESDFWDQLKTGLKQSQRKITATRLETWATPGVPDVLLCDEKGLFHFIKLKATAGHAVDLRPHQVAWLSRHAHSSVWVLVLKLKTKNDPEQLYVYPGGAAMDLKLEGLKVEPLYHSVTPIDWAFVLSLITA